MLAFQKHEQFVLECYQTHKLLIILSYSTYSQPQITHHRLSIIFIVSLFYHFLYASRTFSVKVISANFWRELKRSPQVFKPKFHTPKLSQFLYLFLRVLVHPAQGQFPIPPKVFFFFPLNILPLFYKIQQSLSVANL
jgi:hypothetical protein